MKDSRCRLVDSLRQASDRDHSILINSEDCRGQEHRNSENDQQTSDRNTVPRQVRRNPFARTVPRRRPSPCYGRVDPCVVLFEACSASTRITAGMLAESLSRPSTPKAPTTSLPPPLLRLLPGGTNQFPGRVYLRCGSVPFTAHHNAALGDRIDCIQHQFPPRHPSHSISRYRSAILFCGQPKFLIADHSDAVA
jgi:hypothetical protein